LSLVSLVGCVVLPKPGLVKPFEGIGGSIMGRSKYLVFCVLPDAVISDSCRVGYQHSRSESKIGRNEQKERKSYRPNDMKRNLKMLVVPALIMAGFSVGCSSPKVVETTDPTRPSHVQVAEGYDTLGRKWEGQSAPAAAPTPAPAPAPVVQPEMLTRNEAMALNFTGTITDIDYPNREMTLMGSDGRVATFAVDKEVRRFNEARVGDKVSMDYYLGVTAEIRKPTPDEERNPLVVLDSEARTGLDQAPAGHTTRRIRAVVTIEALDRTAQTVTVKGPRGKRFVARVKDPSRFDRVRVGDTILMTFTEASGVSLKPANE